METEVIDKLFLELSQVTKATTRRELDLQAKIEAMSLPDEVVDLRLLLDCRKDAERMQKEIDRLRDALQSIVTHQRSAAAVIRIADAALAKEAAP